MNHNKKEIYLENGMNLRKAQNSFNYLKKEMDYDDNYVEKSNAFYDLQEVINDIKAKDKIIKRLKKELKNK